MKSHIVLLRMVLNEMGTRCGTSTTNDWNTIVRRINDEGDSFVTITLPQFAKDFQQALDRREVDSTLFLSFRRRACLPAFLQGFTSLVFDISTGHLLDVPDIDAIHSILQICNLLGKIELPCSDAREKGAFKQYVETDEVVARHASSLSPELLREFRDCARRVWWDVLYEMDSSIFAGNIVPKHGPGATADRIRGNAKFSQKLWTQRLEKVFPHWEFLYPNWHHYDAAHVNILEPGEEIPVRVVSVPKTQKTPRIIAIEPAHVQYVQQGLWECFLNSIERHNSLSVLVGFVDQQPNQAMAQIGSLDGSLATLDLSEASDRVSWLLVQELLASNRLTKDAVDACRSRSADVPGFGVIPLAKFASMGSALCFPIEAMVFTTIIFMAISRVSGRPVTRRLLSEFVGKVRVYGDDLIVPAEYVQTVVGLLEAFGLKVNLNKSFWTGKFRESCGKEYYDGHDVSIVKVRRVFPTQLKHADEIISLVSLRNQLYKAGLWSTCQWIDNYIERLIPFPMVAETSQALGRHSFLGYDSTQGECRNLQRPLVRAYRKVDRLPLSHLDGPDALLKFFLKRGDKPYDKNHLKRAGRPESTRIKLGRVAAY